MRRILLVAILILSGWIFLGPTAHAQDDDFFIEEPADFEEPEDFDIPPPPDDGGDPGGPGGFVPPPVRGGYVPPIRGGGRGASQRNTYRSSSDSGGAVEFHLVDPPLYWKKKSRPAMSKPKAY